MANAENDARNCLANEENDAKIALRILGKDAICVNSPMMP
jgi:hypothetical protein